MLYKITFATLKGSKELMKNKKNKDVTWETDWHWPRTTNVENAGYTPVQGQIYRHFKFLRLDPNFVLWKAIAVDDTVPQLKAKAD